MSAECIFMTDIQQPGEKYYNITSHESISYRDIHFQPLKGGFEFGKRYLYHMVWAALNYNFQYFMRVDDDYFLCMDKLLHELPIPMHYKFHWGYMHEIEGISRPEESIILFSNDIVSSFIGQNYSHMKCHPLADQMIATWSLELNLSCIFRHDPRLHHAPIVRLKPELHNIDNVCNQFIGIHGSYEKDTRQFWKKKGSNIIYSGDLLTNSVKINNQKPFEWQLFPPEWRFEPKLCVDRPIWNISRMGVNDGSYGGREETDSKISKSIWQKVLQFFF